MASSSDLRSRLSKVRGLGSAHHGVEHWWWQRVTALAMVPLGAWFMCSLIGNLLSPEVISVAEWFASPIHTVLMLFLAPMATFHAKLGLQVVIEDYVHTSFAKYLLLLTNLYACIAMTIFSILAILKLHFLDISTGGF
ncbi:MAG: succinate dehydrogenase, hydrophobic membrane anchor protein [Alphaproteobacteria bacterium]